LKPCSKNAEKTLILPLINRALPFVKPQVPLNTVLL
jgi:hypothetical protein